ncbi:DUF6341 family protein [Pustulibacterium marinum]|nr:uracil phosphoribosyltransferase [Pustulibacterium marinum]
MKDFFEGIADLFVNVLFAPLDFLRNLELDTWWGANAINFFFIAIGFCALAYWLNFFKEYNRTEPTSTL